MGTKITKEERATMVVKKNDKIVGIGLQKVRFSLEGWNLLDWFKGNWTTIKEIIKIGAPLVLGLQFIADKPVLVFLLTGLGKLGLDTLDYWIGQTWIKK